MANEVYEIVTERIIEQLEQGTIPWKRPWSMNLARSRETGKPYSFMNQMLLGKGGEWLTWKQIQAAGGKVKKGEKSSIVTFWKQLPIEEEQPDGSKVKKVIPFLRYYRVFHIDQCEGIEKKYPEDGATFDNDPIEAGEKIYKEYAAREAKLSHERRDAAEIHSGEEWQQHPIFHIYQEPGSNEAFYSPAGDYIKVPALEQFEVPEEFYSTLFHEMTHSTMHEARCNRKEDRKGKNVAFGSQEYSKEELVAEIGSAFLMGLTGMEIKETQDNSAAYIQNWLKQLKSDKKFITSAAAKAEKAVKYIIGEEITE